MILDVELEEGENNVNATFNNIKREKPELNDLEIMKLVAKIHNVSINHNTRYSWID